MRGSRRARSTSAPTRRTALHPLARTLSTATSRRSSFAIAVIAGFVICAAFAFVAFELLEAPTNPALGDAIIRGSPLRREVALTYDDGPNPPYTEHILDVLRSERVRATFFVVGRAAAAHPATIRAIAEEGSVIGLHGWDHAHFQLEDDATLLRDLARTQSAIDAALARSSSEGASSRSRLVRPPFGQRSAATLDLLRKNGYTPVLWSVPLSGDWEQPGAETIADRSIGSIENGSIVVLHDGDRGRLCARSDASCDRSQEAAATRLIVERLRTRGFSFVTIPELIAHRR